MWVVPLRLTNNRNRWKCGATLAPHKCISLWIRISSIHRRPAPHWTAETSGTLLVNGVLIRYHIPVMSKATCDGKSRLTSAATVPPHISCLARPEIWRTIRHFCIRLEALVVITSRSDKALVCWVNDKDRPACTTLRPVWDTIIRMAAAWLLIKWGHHHRPATAVAARFVRMPANW